MKKNKVLIIAPGFFPLFGGMEEQCYLLSQEFIRNGIVVDLLTEQTNPALERLENIDNINVFRLRHVVNRDLLGFAILAFGLVMFLMKNRSKYDLCIIRTLTYHALIVGILKYLKLISIKTFVTAETGGDNDDVISLKDRKFYKIIVFFLNQHNFLNSICLDNYKHYQELGFDKNKLTRIYNGIDVDKYENSNYPNVLNNFIFLGRLSKTKGIYELLNAFKRIVEIYPRKKLFIGGDGDEKQGIIEFIENNNLYSNIIYEGYVSKNDKENFYKKGDCLVLPSYSEGFPISILEATVYKRKIIVTDVSDIKDIYGESRVTFCNKRDAEDLYNKILYSINEFDLTQLDYDKIIEMVDIKNVVSKIVKLFDEKSIAKKTAITRK